MRNRGRRNRKIPGTETRVWRVAQAAVYVGESRANLYRLVKQGLIPCFRHGRSLRFDRVALAAWIDGKSKTAHAAD